MFDSEAAGLVALGTVLLAIAGFSAYVLMNHIRRFGEFRYGSAPAMFNTPFWGLIGFLVVVWGVATDVLTGLVVLGGVLIITGIVFYCLRHKIVPWLTEWWVRTSLSQQHKPLNSD